MIDFHPGRVQLKHLILLKWTDNQGQAQRFYLMDKIKDKWHTFGSMLGLNVKSLTAQHQGNAEDCCRTVLDQWLDNPPPDYPATWQGLLDLLEDSQLGQVVTDLRTILDKASL